MANSAFLAAMVLLVGGFLLLDQLTFLSRYKRVLLHDYLWVIAGFLAYELAVHFTGSGVEELFDVWRPVVPFIAVVVGFLPGCGPQIVVTSLYLAGAVPLSAQIGNAISNDGDALFPAIALAPRAAIMATLYSALPGLILAYAWFVFVE